MNMGKVSGDGGGQKSRNPGSKKPHPSARSGQAFSQKTREMAHPESESRPTGRNNRKAVGEIAEMQFMLEAARRGFGVARPFANNQRYDVILDAPRRLWRVQVKASGAE